jgi:Sortilin, neurotensin receptor 3,
VLIMVELYVGSEDGLLVFAYADGALELVARAAPGNAVRGIALEANGIGAYVACGLRGAGLFHARDGRAFVQVGFDKQWVWDVLIDPFDPSTIWTGTEPPMLYRSSDKARTFSPCSGIDSLPSRPNWRFFHPPFYAGHVHGLAIPPSQRDTIFAGVEHGALIYSLDRGATWREALVGADVHRVAFDPVDAERVLVGTGNGLCQSDDHGSTFTPTPELSGSYVHGIHFDPHDTRHALVYVADSSMPLHESIDGGRSWQPLPSGPTEGGPADALAFHPTEPNVLFYGAYDSIFTSDDGGRSWQKLNEGLPRIWRMQARAPR